MKLYEICLNDYTPVIAAIARHLDAPYEKGDFERAEEAFAQSGEAETLWSLKGSQGRLEVNFEKHEEYFFCTLFGSGLGFEAVKKLLWETYLDQGGDPKMQERP